MRLIVHVLVIGGVMERIFQKVGTAEMRAWLLLSRLDEARRLAEGAVESLASQHGFAARPGFARRHREPPRALEAESGEAHYLEGLPLAEPRAMRPLIAHCHLGVGKRGRP